jgi:hypothetical protein
MTRESPDGSAAISLVPSKPKQKERLWLPRRRRRLCVPQLHRESIRKRRSIYDCNLYRATALRIPKTPKTIAALLQ